MVSIIVPVYNEEKNIRILQNNLSRLSGDYEIIFSDGGSTDRTLEYIRSDNKAVRSVKGRGAQINAAARAAKGDMLFIIHSDVLIGENILKMIPKDVLKGRKAAYLTIAFRSGNILMKICGLLSGLRTATGKLVYGDQGLIIQKELFMKLGMMPELPLMEDLEFSIQLKKLKIPLVRMHSKILVSDRRYERNGIIKTMIQMQRLKRRYLRGQDIIKIAEEYEDIR